MVTPEVQARAQQYVDNLVAIRRMEEQNAALRWQLLPDVEAAGEIACAGGTLRFRDAQEAARLQQDQLRTVLVQRFGISEKEADGLIEQAKRMSLRFQTVVCYLN